jgi:hypothetical protein
MAQSLDIYIDTTSGTLVSRGAARDGILPTLTRNDSYNLRIRLQERDQEGLLRDLDTSGSSLKLGIGGIDGDPTDGQFRLVLNSITSSAISFNATPLQVYNAISAIAGTGVTVTTYGNENFSYLITAATVNTALSFGGSAFTLFPTSSVLVNTRRFPAASVAAQQVIRLVRNPAVYADTFTAASTAGVISLSQLQVGSSGTTGTNQTWRLSVGPDAEGGNIVLNYGANSTTGIAIGAAAASFSEALSAVTGIGFGNISVEAGNNQGDYTISFVRNLGQQNVTTALTLDASGVIFGNFLQTTCTLSTAELDELFAEAGTDTITPKIEVELTQGGTPKTVLQSDITVRRDLITTGSAVPADQASYLTAAESYAAFVRNSTTGVNSTARSLADSSAVTAVAFGARTLNNSSGTAVVSYGAGLSFSNTPLGFYGVAVTAQPANVNAVSGLINLGLLASGATYGVLPQSPRTLTTTASIYFGAVNGNNTNSVSVVVAGCQVNDIVLIGLPPSNPNGLSFHGHVTTANGLEVDCVNATNGSQTPATATYRITVIGY